MVLPIYLAMTASEIRLCNRMPTHCGYMACHFSSYGRGLTNIPQQLRVGSMLILNDRISPQWHDPLLICYQLAEAVNQLQPAGLLLDMQRPFDSLTCEIIHAIAENVSCPKAVTPAYLANWKEAVLLSPVPPYTLPEEYLLPWAGRNIWLEIDNMGSKLELRENGCSIFPWEADSPEPKQYDEKLCCHYNVELQDNFAIFTLQRSFQDTQNLLQKAKNAGVTLAVGLYQQWQDQLVLFENG